MSGPPPTQGAPAGVRAAPPDVRAAMRLAAGLALMLAGSAAVAEPVDLRVKPVPHFVPSQPEQNRHGRLEFLGGLVLRGPSDFGGLSGLVVEGEQLTAVSDNGHWFTARLMLDGERLVGIEDAALFPRMDTVGTPVASKGRGDAEALARSGDTLFVLVELLGAMLEYRYEGGRLDPDAVPALRQIPLRLARLSSRNGLEGLATRPDGTVLIFSEGRARTQAIEAATLSGTRFGVRRAGTFRITGADTLPGGDVILTERRYDGGLDLGFRVRRIGADALANPSGVVDGPVLLETDLRSEIDNIEGVAAEVRDGNIILTVISDDNFNPLQRTLLLRFKLGDPLPRPKPIVAGG